MDVFKETDSLSVYQENAECSACQTPDRKHADALLNISEESFAKEKDSFESHLELGWGDAIQGWGRLSPLACLFQMQKKGKKPKMADNDYHCLLCVDRNFLKHSESDPSIESVLESTKTNCRSDKNHQDKSIPTPVVFLNGPSRHPFHITSPVTEHHTLKLFTEAIKQAASADKISEETEMKILEETSPKLGYTSDLIKQCPLMKDRSKNVTMIINSFTVLPPVKAEGASNLTCPSLLKGTVSTFDLSTAQSIRDGGGSHGTSALGERAGVERMWEIAPQSHTCAAAPDVRFLTSVAWTPSYWLWPSQSSKNLPSALAIPNPSKCDLPFNTVGDSRPVYPMGRLKCDDLSKLTATNNRSHRLNIALKSKSITETEPQLPLLLGTRVPMPSSHRLL